MPTSIAFVEHDRAVLGMLTSVFGGAPAFQVVGGFTSVTSALEQIPTLPMPPGVVLMDIHFPQRSGIECTLKLKETMPDLLVLMLTALNDSETLFQALRAGADGYLLKRTPSAGIVAAVEEALQGGAPMTPGIARKVLRLFDADRQRSAHLSELTPREREVLEHLARFGSSDKEIAQVLHISVETVGFHFRGIYTKLRVRSRSEAVVRYYRPETAPDQ